eukprot:9512567-Karenia_brevis.AAC.1
MNRDCAARYPWGNPDTNRTWHIRLDNGDPDDYKSLRIANGVRGSYVKGIAQEMGAVETGTKENVTVRPAFMPSN